MGMMHLLHPVQGTRQKNRCIQPNAAMPRQQCQANPVRLLWRGQPVQTGRHIRQVLPKGAPTHHVHCVAGVKPLPVDHAARHHGGHHVIVPV